MTLSEIKSKIQQAEGKRKLLQSQLTEAGISIKYFTDYLQSLEKAQVLLQTVAQETQSMLKFHIEDICQLAIDTVFPDTYEFKIEFELKRGRTEARIFLLENGNEIDPMEASGGGLVDILSFSLRFAAWSLSKTAKVIILDEPFKFLDRERKPLAMDILKQLSIKLGLQVICVTHDAELVDIADNLINVELVQEGKWKASKVTGGMQ